MSLRISQMQGSDAKVYENILSEAGFRIRCCIPCIVQSYNSENNTVECQPAIRERIIKSDNTTEYVNLPLLINVPVVFPYTGHCGIKFPIQKNDEVLVIFSDLSIDNFWEKGSVQNPIEARRHDLSDGIAIPCSLSLPKQGLTPTTMIELSGSNIAFKAGNTQTNIISLVNKINALEAKLELLEGIVNTHTTQINTNTQNITINTNNITSLTDNYNAHKHTVTVGDNTYTTTTPF